MREDGRSQQRRALLGGLDSHVGLLNGEAHPRRHRALPRLCRLDNGRRLGDARIDASAGPRGARPGDADFPQPGICLIRHQEVTARHREIRLVVTLRHGKLCLGLFDLNLRQAKLGLLLHR